MLKPQSVRSIASLKMIFYLKEAFCPEVKISLYWNLDREKIFLKFWWGRRKKLKRETKQNDPERWFKGFWWTQQGSIWPKRSKWDTNAEMKNDESTSCLAGTFKISFDIHWNIFKPKTPKVGQTGIIPRFFCSKLSNNYDKWDALKLMSPGSPVPRRMRRDEVRTLQPQALGWTYPGGCLTSDGELITESAALGFGFQCYSGRGVEIIHARGEITQMGFYYLLAEAGSAINYLFKINNVSFPSLEKSLGD